MPDVEKALKMLLVDLFSSAAELERFVLETPLSDIHSEVSWSASLSSVADRLVETIIRYEKLNSELFYELEARFPRREAELARVKQQLISQGGYSDLVSAPISGPPRPVQAISALLRDVFADSDSFRQFIALTLPDQSLIQELSTSVPLNELLTRAALLLVKRGLEHEALEQIAQKFPDWRKRVAGVKRFLDPREESKVSSLAEETPSVLFLVRGKENLGAGPDLAARFPQVILDYSDNWNDFGLKTRYIARLYLSPEDEHSLGSVKIMRISDEARDNVLPERFKRLGESYLSLGSRDWYAKLLEHPALAPQIAESLHDAAIADPAQFPQFQDDNVFRNSLMRDYTDIRSWRDIMASAAPLRRLLQLPEPRAEDLALPRDDSDDGTASPPEGQIRPPDQPIGKDSASAAESHGGGTPDPALETAQSSSYTLDISKDAVRLFAGICVDGRATPLWSSNVSNDWSRPHFVDHEDRPCALSEAVRMLPAEWDREETRRFGQTLTRLVFGSTPDPIVLSSLTVKPGDRRRLVLVLDAESFRIPWEYLVLGDNFLIEQRVSFVRHVESTVGGQPIKLAGVSAVLFAYANPATPAAPSYDVEFHLDQLETAIRSIKAQVSSATRCTVSRLQELLASKDGEVFHFLGHGEQGDALLDGALCLHREGGEPGDAPITAEKLSQLLGQQQRRLVILGACHGATVPDGRLLASVGWRIARETGTPVVAMQMAVHQEFSTKFAAEFYRRLHTAGYDIEAAVFMARRIEHEERHAFGIPALLADARNLDDVPTLTGNDDEWAKFQRVVVHVVTARAEQAARSWEESAVASAEDGAATAQVIREDAKNRDPQIHYACAPDRPEELGPRLDDVRNLVADEGSREKVPKAPPRAEPRPPPVFRKPRPIHVDDDVPLDLRIAVDRRQAAYKDIAKELCLPPDIIPRIVGELMAGRHVLLTGPVGTGKTSLAQAVAKAFGYATHLETLSADWTRFEIVGGFWPEPVEGKQQLVFTFRPGVFVEAVRANWIEEGSSGDADRWRHARKPDGTGGAWLILDELNRADVDRALGGVFSALENRRLRIPADGGSLDLPIPKDFRVIATINAVDRHFLFRLSDALKRRFAFVHVPVATDWTREWELVCSDREPEPGEQVDDLRRFVALVRTMHPLGTALLRAAVHFMLGSESSTAEAEGGEWRLAQGIEGSILPNLEDVGDPTLKVLRCWAEHAMPGQLVEALLDALPEFEANQLTVLKQLKVVPCSRENKEMPTIASKQDAADWIAGRLTRRDGAPALAGLVRRIGEMLRGATNP